MLCYVVLTETIGKLNIYILTDVSEVFFSIFQQIPEYCSVYHIYTDGQ